MSVWIADVLKQIEQTIQREMSCFAEAEPIKWQEPNVFLIEHHHFSMTESFHKAFRLFCSLFLLLCTPPPQNCAVYESIQVEYGAIHQDINERFVCAHRVEEN